MYRVLAIIITNLLLVLSSALADDISGLRGNWVCTSGCGCTPASPHRYASITSSGTARNECGAEAALSLSGNRLQAKEWVLGGTVTPDGATINWDNASAWTRLPKSATDLDKSIAGWESRTFYCVSDAGSFPSKEPDSAAPCDDGDSVMFNALLCRSGDPRGCNTVKLSQDEEGRFWRSPRKRLMHPKEPSAADDARAELQKRGKEETTFSGDHATGLFVYFGHTGDREKEAFAKWIRWINSNERCLTFCGFMPIGTPRFCKNDRCAFGPGDCSTLLLLGRRLGVGVPFCSVDPISPIPTVQNVAQGMKNFYDHTIGRFPIQPPDLKFLRDNFDRALKAYEDAIAPIEQLRTKIEAEAVLALMIPQIKAAISAKVNDRGFSRHNALVQIMILQDWGLGKHWMTEKVNDVANDEPLNPYFQYVAKRRSNKDSMLPLIAKECPDEAPDVRHPRRQWSWERDTAKEEWKTNMYWDCLFIAAMYRENSSIPPDDDSTENALRALLADAIKVVQEAEAQVKAALEQIEDLLKKVNPVATIKENLDALKDAATHPGDALEKKVDEVKDVINNPGEAAKDPVGTAQKVIPIPGPKIPGPKIH